VLLQVQQTVSQVQVVQGQVVSVGKRVSLTEERIGKIETHIETNISRQNIQGNDNVGLNVQGSSAKVTIAPRPDPKDDPAKQVRVSKRVTTPEAVVVVRGPLYVTKLLGDVGSVWLGTVPHKNRCKRESVLEQYGYGAGPLESPRVFRRLGLVSQAASAGLG
jgi:hypothetical protein